MVKSRILLGPGTHQTSKTPNGCINIVSLYIGGLAFPREGEELSYGHLVRYEYHTDKGLSPTKCIELGMSELNKNRSKIITAYGEFAGNQIIAALFQVIELGSFRKREVEMSGDALNK